MSSQTPLLTQITFEVVAKHFEEVFVAMPPAHHNAGCIEFGHPFRYRLMPKCVVTVRIHGWLGGPHSIAARRHSRLLKRTLFHARTDRKRDMKCGLLPWSVLLGNFFEFCSDSVNVGFDLRMLASDLKHRSTGSTLLLKCGGQLTICPDHLIVSQCFRTWGFALMAKRRLRNTAFAIAAVVDPRI